MYIFRSIPLLCNSVLCTYLTKQISIHHSAKTLHHRQHFSLVISQACTSVITYITTPHSAFIPSFARTQISKIPIFLATSVDPLHIPPYYYACLVTMWSRRLKLPTPPPLLGTRAASLRSSPWSRKGSRIPPLRQKPQNIPSQRNPSSPPPREDQPNAQSESENPAQESLSATLRNTNPQDNTLLAPVHIPEDPNAVLKERHPAAGLLANSGLVVQRQLEMMNVLL